MIFFGIFCLLALCHPIDSRQLEKLDRRKVVHSHDDHCFTDVVTGSTPAEQKILCKVFQEYTPLLRPVRNWTTGIRVGVSLAINQIFELDERNQLLITNAWIDQEWTDEFMVWDPKVYGLTIIRLPARYLWLPDIVLYNNGAEYINRPIQLRAMVKYDGTIFFPTPVKLYSSCTVDVTYFPFDTQTCWLKFGSWSHDISLVDIFGRVEEIDLSRFVTNGQWDIVGITHKRHRVRYSCCVEVYSDLTFYITMKRKVLHYIINIFFPSFIMSTLTMLTFMMPPESGEKLTLGITVLLSFSVYMLSVTEKLPETSEYVPLISIYICFVMSILSMSISATITVLAINYRRPKITSQKLRYRRPSRIARRFTQIFVREHDLEKAALKHNQKFFNALSEAETEVMKSYTRKRKRREAVTFVNENCRLLADTRRVSSLSDLLYKQSMFTNIKTLLDNNEEMLANDVVLQEDNEQDEEITTENIEGSEIHKELRCDIIRIINRLIKTSARQVRFERVILEWKLFSTAIDRVLFTLFVLVTASVIATLLLVSPALHHYYMSVGIHQSLSGAVEYPEVNGSFIWSFKENRYKLSTANPLT